METVVIRAGYCCQPDSLLKCVTCMETDVTRAGDCCERDRLYKCVTCKKLILPVQVPSVSPTGY
jgi:hypothetical protein